VRRREEVASWSPKESGLIRREDSGEALRFNCEKINLEDCGRCVPAVVRGRCTDMELMSDSPIQPTRKARRRKRKKVSSGISVTFAA
jgi:hypothetical protein